MEPAQVFGGPDLPHRHAKPLQRRLMFLEIALESEYADGSQGTYILTVIRSRPVGESRPYKSIRAGVKPARSFVAC